jgi:nicotinamidase-related amidase
VNSTGDSTSDVRATYRAAGFTGAFTLGIQPAVIVVDFCRGFTDPACPLGADMDETLARTRQLLDAARRRKVPIVFTTIAYDDATRAATAWLRKVPSLAELAVGSPWVEIDPRLGRLSREPVVAKTGASAFFGTALHAMLVAGRIDTVLVTGATTSGCVRATVVDAVQNGFSTFVVTDCVADRSAGPHEANLFDMTAKYADPLTAEEVMGYLTQLPEPVAG